MTRRIARAALGSGAKASCFPMEDVPPPSRFSFSSLPTPGTWVGMSGTYGGPLPVGLSGQFGAQDGNAGFGGGIGVGDSYFAGAVRTW